MKENKYLRFFVVSDAPILMESIYCESYKDFKCCSIRKDNEICVFFKEIDICRTNDAGLKLIESDHAFTRYVSAFSEFLQMSDSNFLHAIKQDDAVAVIKLILEFLKYYRFTEYFYTDKSFDCQNRAGYGESFEEKLKILGNLKFNARKVLNSIFMGENCYINLLAHKLADKMDILNMCITDIMECKIPSPLLVQNHLITYNQEVFSELTEEYQEVSKLYFRNKKVKKISGMAASKGICEGNAFVLSSDFSNFEELSRIIDEMPENVILISETTSPELVRACHKAIGIVTNQGGLGSHAAIISRELKIPCVVGTGNATILIQTGDNIMVDGNSGNVVVM